MALEEGEESEPSFQGREKMPLPHGSLVAGTPLSIALRWGDGQAA